MSRLRLRCRGVVQGVGFRPFVHRLATQLGLGGSVENVAGAVLIELTGERPDLERFLRRLPDELPPPARLEPLQPHWQESGGAGGASAPGLRIAAAAPRPLAAGLVTPALCPDRAPCPDCLAELADPADRRHGYPFISCSLCGPRYSIATAEPYARAHTTLADFVLCPDCRREFENPSDRRFHAETIGCPACGPRLRLLDAEGRPVHGSEEGSAVTPADPLAQACAWLAAGRILALQGVGGFQLLVDAGDAEAIRRLRRRKRRPTRPLALLVAEPAWIETEVRLDDAERAALAGPAAPIVLLRRRFAAAATAVASAAAARQSSGGGWALAREDLAPGAACLGVMLPASPLHHLLIRSFGRPLVATSGNRSGEPLCTAPAEAIERLAGIADGFLVHDRPIARGLDDSVLQLIDGRPSLLRRARGYAPEALPLATAAAAASGGERDGETGPEDAVLALGGDLKCAPALAVGDRLWLAPHLGDLADPRGLARLRAGLAEIRGHWGGGDSGPGAGQLALGCDAHPGYLSHQLARSEQGTPVAVPHHLAHGLAVMAEHRLAPPLLVLACDGLGFGEGEPEERAGATAGAAVEDPSLRGGELLWIGAQGERRLACLRPFPLPGGERAMGEPRRAALGLLLAAEPLDGREALAHPGARLTRDAFTPDELSLLRRAVSAGCNAPFTTSLGRLFDAVASLLGLVQVLRHEGEGGMRLQGAAARAAEPADARGSGNGTYPLPRRPPPQRGLPDRLDWGPLLAALLRDAAAAGSPELCALRFHRSVARGLSELAAEAAAREGCRRVALAGGCFQNRLLLELTIADLRARGLEPFWGEAVPVNDGGLAVGQALAVRRQQRLCGTEAGGSGQRT